MAFAVVIGFAPLSNAAEPVPILLEISGHGVTIPVAITAGKETVIDNRKCQSIVSSIKESKPVKREHCVGQSGSISPFNEHFVALSFLDVRLVSMNSQTVGGIKVDLPHTAEEAITTFVKVPSVGGKEEFMTGWSLSRKQ
jgi:hypothetical protein